jgi:hypothetical protein
MQIRVKQEMLEALLREIGREEILLYSGNSGKDWTPQEPWGTPAPKSLSSALNFNDTQAHRDLVMGAKEGARHLASSEQPAATVNVVPLEVKKVEKPKPKIKSGNPFELITFPKDDPPPPEPEATPESQSPAINHALQAAFPVPPAPPDGPPSPSGVSQSTGPASEAVPVDVSVTGDGPAPAMEQSNTISPVPRKLISYEPEDILGFSVREQDNINILVPVKQKVADDKGKSRLATVNAMAAAAEAMGSTKTNGGWGATFMFALVCTYMHDLVLYLT